MKRKILTLKNVFNGVLNYLAYIIIYPIWLVPLIHKIRGVRINSVFNTYIAPQVLFDTLFPELITIEEDVYITRGVKLITHINFTESISQLIDKKTIKGNITIKKGAFIGIGAIILHDVTIGECAIVGAGTVVTKNVPPYSVVVGNPMIIKGDIRKMQKNIF